MQEDCPNPHAGGGGGGGFLLIEGIAYMRLKVGASRKGVLMAVTNSAWSLKPVCACPSPNTYHTPGAPGTPRAITGLDPKHIFL